MPGREVSREPPRGPQTTEGNSFRNPALVVGGSLVLLVALGITLVLALPSASSNPAPVKPKATQREGAAALPLPSPQAERPLPKPDQKGAKTDVPADGEPSLAQAFVDRWFAYLEWLLEIRLTEPQRRDWQQLWVQHWQATDRARKDRFRAYADAELRWWSEAARQSDAEGAELRAERRLPLLARLQRSADPDERLLLALYESAHAPGTERNPILVPGTLPLTREMVDEGRRWDQWVLDVRLTAPQRQEYQRLLIKNWKTWDQVQKDDFFQNNARGVLSRVLLLSTYARNLLRAQYRSQVLANLQNSPGDELAQLLLAVHESAHRPGGERNPVLVPGRTPLTRDMVGQFGDFLEWVLDLRASGGLTEAQRQVLRDLLMKSWEERNESWKTAFVGHLQKWHDLVRLSDGERARVQEKLQPDLVAQLRSTPTPLNRWLLEIAAKEQSQPDGQERGSSP